MMVPVETAAGNPWALPPCTIAVNARGERYIDEARGYVAHGTSVLAQPAQQASLIFGKAVVDSDAAQSTLSTYQRLGIEIHEAASIVELAEKIAVPAEALTRTVDDYNSAIQGEQAPGLEPPKSASARPEGPAFYAIHPVSPGVTLTFGGIMIDGSARVLAADGRVIAGLYAAGEGAGASFYDDYIGGASLTDCLVVGRVARRQASACRVRLRTHTAPLRQAVRDTSPGAAFFKVSQITTSNHALELSERSKFAEDHRRAARAGGRRDDGGGVPAARDQQRHLLRLWTTLPVQAV